MLDEISKPVCKDKPGTTIHRPSPIIKPVTIANPTTATSAFRKSRPRVEVFNHSLTDNRFDRLMTFGWAKMPVTNPPIEFAIKPTRFFKVNWESSITTFSRISYNKFPKPPARNPRTGPNMILTRAGKNITGRTSPN